MAFAAVTAGFASVFDAANQNAVAPEAAGGEIVGTLGAGAYVHSNLFLYLDSATTIIAPSFCGRA